MLPIVAMLVLVSTVVSLPCPAHAWDTADAPGIAGHPAADLKDAYFFLDPDNNNFVILAATLRGFVVPAQNANMGFFDSGVKVRFEVENTGDAKPDVRIEVRFEERVSPVLLQQATIKLPSGKFEAVTTISRGAFGPQGPPTFGDGTSAQQTPTVTTDGASDVSFFAGLVEDPFFFDLPSFEAYRRSRLNFQTNPAILTRGRDSFAGYNTLAVVLRVPVSALAGDSTTILGLSVSAKGRGGLKDRVGHPFVNGLLINYESRDDYNAAKTTQDAAGKFSEQILANLTALQTSAPFANILLAVAAGSGDILRLNTAIPNTGPEGGTNPEAAYPNGRRPNDDVVDTVLTLVNNGVFQGDAVNDNESPFRSNFPFFASPHMPFPPGAGSEDLTRN